MVLASALLVGCKEPPKFDPSQYPDAGADEGGGGDGGRAQSLPGDRPDGTASAPGDAGDGGAPLLPDDGDAGPGNDGPDAPAGPDGPAADVALPPPDTMGPPRDTMGPPSDACASPTDPRNCGTCGNDCTALPNLKQGAAVSCVGGQCSFALSECKAGFTHCSSNVADGCEVDLGRPQSCGSCTKVCAAGELCMLSGGSYSCALSCTGATPDNCSGKCTNRAIDPQNCGTCGKDCAALPHLRANPPVSCNGSACALGTGACASGWANCNDNPADGCEADLSRPETCGSCTPCAAGNVCTPSGSSFQCTCPAGTPNTCGSLCVNLQTDRRNCGSCSRDCGALPNVKPGASVSCSGGQCVIPAASCATGFGDCSMADNNDGCETQVTSNTHCNACNAACSGGRTCNGAAGSASCTCPASKPTTCSSTCVNLNEDPNNCGNCGQSCLGGPCANGQCQMVEIYPLAGHPGPANDLNREVAFDSQHIYFIRDKVSGGATRVMARINKDGSGFMDLTGTDIVAKGFGLQRGGGFLYWFGNGDVRRCSTPSCASPGPVFVDQPQAFSMFTDASSTRVYWHSDDPNNASIVRLMRSDQSTPVATSNGFFGGAADSNYIYINMNSGLVRIPIGGGSPVTVANGQGSIAGVNSSRVFIYDGNTLPGGGFSSAIWSVPTSDITSSRTLVGEYDQPYGLDGGLVADDTHIYWLINGRDKVTGTDMDMLFRCPVTGCGLNPTILAKGTNFFGDLKTDGQALYIVTDGGRILRLAK